MSKLIKKSETTTDSTLPEFVNFVTNSSQAKLGFRKLSQSGEGQTVCQELARRAQKYFDENPDAEKLEFPVTAVIYRPKASDEAKFDNDFAF